MAVVLVLLFAGLVWWLGYYTHHGEGISVPDFSGLNYHESMSRGDELGLIVLVGDSTYNKKMPAGCVVSQKPLAGTSVKSGRIVYLTINRRGKAPVRMPDLIRNVTVRVAETQLKQLGFHLAPTQYVQDEPEDLVIGIKQGSHNVYGGDMVSVDRALTLVAGGGFVEDSLEVDTFGIVSDGGFDIEL
jgi:beta-lactam-binding protein with PASTA domain